jgi:hypothetical protein
MGKIFAISYVDKSEFREDILNSLFEEKTTEVKFDFLWGKSNKLTKNIFKSKVYKRENAALNKCKSLNITYKNENTKISLDKYYTLDRRLILNQRNAYTSALFTNPEFHFKVIDITEIWNKSIEVEIEKETRSFEIKKLRLMNKKV